MNPSLRPIFLLADSQLLFADSQQLHPRENGLLIADRIRCLIEHVRPRAAYIGASNQDDPDFFQIFEAAMSLAGIDDCRMIHSAVSEDEAAYLESADIICLAGGDVETGWRVFEQNGLAELIPRRYSEGAVLLGLSAGAVQCGQYGWREGGDEVSMFETLKLVPFIVGVHEEASGWDSLKKAVMAVGGRTHGIGIPSGGGLMLHSDRSIEPLRRAASEVSLVHNQIVCNPLPPGIQWEPRDTSGK